MVDFSVVPAALRANVKLLQQASENWQRAYSELNNRQLAEDALGLLAKMAGVPSAYNAALHDVADKIRRGSEVLTAAADALGAVAAEYERKDEEYAKKFGYIGDGMPDRPPTPATPSGPAPELPEASWQSGRSSTGIVEALSAPPPGHQSG
ncbi:hypothetical protein C3Y87_05650 [Carbonactinospora thermoautotrophica]|uniref:hypothetical protein n=1 Tax=Carbonactinospora thermoautotrophica TaxID=1469144 RepID=UPI002271F990|nr:hypothetical protein [Carbonactinospora thermoautotrophica]MCX9190905.1 hypothetical protein [Carbonactinospora thermoautotrophica]